MDNFLTWEYVASFIGLIFSTGMVVEFLKELPVIKNIPTKYFTAIVAFLIILFSSIFLGAFRFVDIPLMGLNAILVTFTASGQYDFHYRKVKLIEDNSELK